MPSATNTLVSTHARRPNGITEEFRIILTTHYLDEAETLCGRIAMLKNGQIVALDSTRNLLAGFPEKYLRLTLDGSGLPEQLEALVVGRAGNSFTLALQDYAAVEPILAALREAALPILEMELAPPDLEEAFVKIMNRQ